jgi:hypothetical protein
MFQKAWSDRNHVLEIRKFQKLLHDLCRRTGANSRPGKRRGREFALDYMQKVVRALIPPRINPTIEIHFYRGSTFLAMIALYFYFTRVHSPTKRRAMERILREEFSTLVDKIADRIVEFYRELDPDKTDRDAKEAEAILGKPGRARGVKSGRAAPAKSKKPRPGRQRRGGFKRPR